MSKQLLIEHFPFIPNPQQLTEARSNPSSNLIVSGKLQTANKVNANKRVYRYDTLKREIDKYIQGPVAESRATGELDHPETSVVELKNVSHCIRRIWWEGQDAYGDIEVLPTPSGNILKTLILNGIKVGISSRALGSTRPLDENTVEVEDDLELICWDFVSTPSTPGAYMYPKTNLQEGQLNESFIPQTLTPKQERLNAIMRDLICDQTGVCCIR
jgi:hypothetical protein